MYLSRRSGCGKNIRVLLFIYYLHTNLFFLIKYLYFKQNNKSHSSDDDVAPAVLTTESVHINIVANNSKKQNTPKQIHSAPAVIDIPITTMTSSAQIQSSISSLTTLASNQTSTATTSAAQVSGLRTIELSTGRVREGFANGDIIVTLLPINTKWPWITPAIFRPELVPEELMAQGLTVRFLLLI